LLAGWLARPDWSLANILMVTHDDKLDCLMIINSASFKFLLPLELLPWWHFSLCFLLFAGNQEE
jgi:hypothetical protein